MHISGTFSLPENSEHIRSLVAHLDKEVDNFGDVVVLELRVILTRAEEKRRLLRGRG
jgi:hypothetical protein